MDDDAVYWNRNDLEMMRRRHLWPGDVLCLKNHRLGEFAVLLYYQKHYRFIPRRDDGFEEEKARNGGDELLVALVEEGWLVD